MGLHMRQLFLGLIIRPAITAGHALFASVTAKLGWCRL